MGGRNGIGKARRDRAVAASSRRASARRQNLKRITDAWWALLFDVARGKHVGPLPKRAGDALAARGLVDAAGGLTREGYVRLMYRRGDPIADRSDDDRAAYYEALRDAPAWPAKGAE